MIGEQGAGVGKDAVPAGWQAGGEGAFEFFAGGVPGEAAEPGAARRGAADAGEPPGAGGGFGIVVALGAGRGAGADARDQGRLVGSQGGGDGALQGLVVVGRGLADGPARGEAGRQGLGVRQGGDDGQAAEPQRAGGGGRLLGQAGFEIGAGGEHPGPVVDEGAAEACGERPFGHGGAQGGPERLSRGIEHRGGEALVGAEEARERRGQGGKDGGQQQAVAVGPLRVGRVEPQGPGDEQCGGVAEAGGGRAGRAAVAECGREAGRQEGGFLSWQGRERVHGGGLSTGLPAPSRPVAWRP